MAFILVSFRLHCVYYYKLSGSSPSNNGSERKALYTQLVVFLLGVTWHATAKAMVPMATFHAMVKEQDFGNKQVMISVQIGGQTLIKLFEILLLEAYTNV